MGYTITIGQLEICKEPEDGLECSCIRFGANLVRHDSAPAFGEPTDHENQRWPSYSAWAETLRDVGLYGVFYHEGGHLIGGHPGVRLVTQDMKGRIDEALHLYRAANPTAELKFSGTVEANLCRLLWLHYWITWALENCETPVIANS